MKLLIAGILFAISISMILMRAMGVDNPFVYIIILGSWLMYLTLMVFIRKPPQLEIILDDLPEFERVEDRVAGQARQLNEFRVTLDKEIESLRLNLDEELGNYKSHLDTFATSMHQLNDICTKLEKRIDYQNSLIRTIAKQQMENKDTEQIAEKGEQIIESQKELCDLASKATKDALDDSNVRRTSVDGE